MLPTIMSFSSTSPCPFQRFTTSKSRWRLLEQNQLRTRHVALAITVITCFAASTTSNATQYLSPTWLNNNDVTYNIDDDLAAYTDADGNAHDNPSYTYSYCKRGVLHGEDYVISNVESNADFPFPEMYWNDDEDQRESTFFIMRRNFEPGGYVIAGGYGIAWPDSAEWTSPTSVARPRVSLPVPQPGDSYYLFSNFHFPSSLRARNLADVRSEGPVIDENSTQLILLAHGWNGGGELTDDWLNVAQSLAGWLSKHEKSEWQLVYYDWGQDAATGGLFTLQKEDQSAEEKDVQTVIGNATEAAEIGHWHGRYLGKLLHDSAPNLEKIQLIGFSAGAWVARGAATYLLAHNPRARVQVTLLDPFMPRESLNDSTALGKAAMDDLGSINGNIDYLENYYSYFDETGFGLPFAAGTRQIFDWGGEPDGKKPAGGLGGLEL